jgi:hypothetical protein
MFPAKTSPLCRLLVTAAIVMPLDAQLVCLESFNDYGADVQMESGANGSSGTALDGGYGWGSPYDINNAIKDRIKAENRSASPVIYTNGGITIYGGNRALRFYDAANGSYALQRPLGTVFQAAAGDTLWCSILFRTATGGASPLANQDFFQIGFDDSASATSPRVSFGSNASQSTFPSPARFFARSTTTIANSDFHDGLDIAPATTYLLVVRIQPNAGVYDTVSLFVNPATIETPATPSAEIVLSSGLASLSHAFIRTVNLDMGDAYVLDEWHIGRDYASVVQSLHGSLRGLPPSSPSFEMELRWPVALQNVALETSTTLAPDSWSDVPGPFTSTGAEWNFPVPIEPGTTRRFFRLRR